MNTNTEPKQYRPNKDTSHCLVTKEVSLVEPAGERARGGAGREAPRTSYRRHSEEQ